METELGFPRSIDRIVYMRLVIIDFVVELQRNETGREEAIHKTHVFLGQLRANFALLEVQLHQEFTLGELMNLEAIRLEADLLEVDLERCPNPLRQADLQLTEIGVELMLMHDRLLTRGRELVASPNLSRQHAERFRGSFAL